MVLEQLDQPVPEHGGVRQLLPGRRVQPALADPPRRGQCFQGFLEQVSVQGGELELPLRGAVAVGPDREVRQRPRLGLLLLQLLALGLIGGLGADHLEEPFAQLPQRRGVERLGLVDHVRLGPRLGPGRQVVVLRGQRLDRGGHDRRLLHIDHPRRKRTTGDLEPVVELPRQVQIPMSAGGRGLRRVRQPRRRRGGTGVGADAVAVGLHQQPQLQLGQPGLLLAELDQRLTLLALGHRPQRHLDQPVQRTRERRREPHHRMRLRHHTRGRWRRNQRQGHATHARRVTTPVRTEIRAVDNPVPMDSVDESRLRGEGRRRHDELEQRGRGQPKTVVLRMGRLEQRG